LAAALDGAGAGTGAAGEQTCTPIEWPADRRRILGDELERGTSMVIVVIIMVLWASAAVFSCRQAVRAWRDPDYARGIFFPNPSSDPAVRRGHVRGLVPLAGFLVSIGIVVLISAVAAGLPSAEGRGLAIAAFMPFFLCIGLHCTILWFNWPKFLVLPHMRDEIGTVTEWWRWRRDIRIALKEAAERDAQGHHPDSR
jgi:hypothetical protein